MANDTCALTVIGRTTDDIKLEGEFEIAKFSIANNYSVKKGKEYIQESQFFNVQLTGQKAKFASSYIKKGSLVCVCGDLRTEYWVGKDGIKKSKQVLHANNIQLLATKKDNSDNYSNNEDSSFEVNDDIPF